MLNFRSLSLRNDTSQTRIVYELKQLNQHLENSTSAAADDEALFEIDKSDAHVIRNLKSLVRAARDFHASASIQASTIASGSQFRSDVAQDHGYASSVVHPATTTSKRRQVEMFIRQARRPSRKNSRTPSGNFPLPSSPVQADYPEVVADEEVGLGLENHLDSTLSGGFSKMAQKALRKFDFAKAEKVLRQALDRHRISAPDDAHHSRLRTQLAICGFLQGKGSEIENDVIDLAEFRGTKRSVAHQLLYNLALSLMHDLNFEAAHKICVTLWANLSRPEFASHVKKSDLFRLLVISYRESDKALYAEALEEQHPELATVTDDGLPSMLESVISCEELLVEFLGVNDSSEVPRRFIHQLRDRAELGRKSPFDVKWTKQQLQRAADPGRPSSEVNGQEDTKRHTSLRQAAATGVSGNHKASYTERLSRLKTVLHWQSTHNKEKSEASAIATDGTVSQTGGTHKTVHSPQIFQKTKTYCARHNEMPLWQRLSPLHRRRMLRRRGESDIATDENGNRILSWMRSHDSNGKVQIVTSEEPHTLDDVEPRVCRQFSFVGMPSTPYTGSQHWAIHLAEMPDTPLFEMMDTSPRVELADTELAPVEIIERCRIARSGSLALTSVANSTHVTYEVSDLASSHGAAAKSNTAYQVSEISYSRVAEAALPGSPLLETSNQYISQISRPVFSNGVESGDTQKSDLLLPAAEPILAPLQQKRSSLYPTSNQALANPEAQSTSSEWSLNKDVSVGQPESLTPEMKDMVVQKNENSPQSPSHDFGCKLWHTVQNSDPEVEQSPPLGMMAIWSSLLLFSKTTRKLQKHNRVQSREKTGWIRNIQAKLKCVVPDTMSETSIPVRNRVHRTGLVYEYLGPQAVAGPYTEQASPLQSSHQPQRGVPMLSDNSENIRIPVELDSRQIKAVRYA
jgi:hypothetical protein